MKGEKVGKEEVLSALRAVKDPELGRDIVELGFVRDLSVDGGKVTFTLQLTTPSCPFKERLVSEARRAVESLPGVREVEVRVEARVPALPRKERLPGVKHVIAVASGKGGVGKTTISVNMAVSLALDGASVGLLDADIYGPDVPPMMGMEGERPRVRGEKILPIERHGVRVMSIGFLIEREAAVIWRGPLMSKAIQEFLREVEWGDLDYLVVDLPPGTGDAPLTVAQTVPLSGGVVVATPQKVALEDVRRMVSMFRRLEVPVLGVVENMSYLVCPHCGGRVEVFPSGGARRAAEELGVPFLGEVPLDPEVVKTGDEGEPLIASRPSSPTAEALRGLARRVAGALSVLSLGETPS